MNTVVYKCEPFFYLLILFLCTIDLYANILNIHVHSLDSNALLNIYSISSLSALIYRRFRFQENIQYGLQLMYILHILATCHLHCSNWELYRFCLLHSCRNSNITPKFTFVLLSMKISIKGLKWECAVRYTQWIILYAFSLDSHKHVNLCHLRRLFALHGM